MQGRYVRASYIVITTPLPRPAPLQPAATVSAITVVKVRKHGHHALNGDVTTRTEAVPMLTGYRQIVVRELCHRSKQECPWRHVHSAVFR
jgi:hypothetical protein